MIFLSDLTPTEIGTSGFIIAIITILTVLGFVRGAVKLVFLVFTLAGAGYAGYWGSMEGLTYLQRQWPAAPEQLGSVFAVICGLIAFFFLSKIFSFFTDPFENSGVISSVAFGVPAALVSLIAATGLVWLSLNFLKDKGAEGEIKYWITQDDENEDARLKSYPTLANLKRSFESSGVGRKMAGLYNLHDREKFNLAKLIVIAQTSEERLRELGKDERVVKIMRNLEVNKLIRDTGLKQQIAKNDVQGVLANPLLLEALQDKSLMEDLSAINSKELR